jgi:hypothetical protein
MDTIAWDEMTWLNEPAASEVEGGRLVVTTGRETDFWRKTSYGFTHDDGHFLGAPLPGEFAMEVCFRADFHAQFDQAGLMLRAGPELWLKTGVELSDGELYASVVVTIGQSDWSVSPIPSSARGRALTFRASRSGDSVTIRFRIGDEPSWRFLRLAYLPADAEILAGPMCCSPTRGGLAVSFEPVRVGPPDVRLHQA